MADDDFDGEKTQFWLPGQEPPGMIPKQDKAASEDGAAANVDAQSVDFDITAEHEVDATASVDFDLTAEIDTSGTSMDFDISGGDTSETPTATPTPPPAAPAPTPMSESPSGGGLLLGVIVIIAIAVIYLVTR